MLNDLEKIHDVLLEAYKAVLLLSGIDLDKEAVTKAPTEHVPLWQFRLTSQPSGRKNAPLVSSVKLQNGIWMNPEIRENIVEKLRLVSKEQLAIIDKDIEQMLAEHARDGLVRSGNTIKKTMNFIASSNASLYKETLNHIKTLDLNFYHKLESDIQVLAEEKHASFKNDALQRLKKSTEIAGHPDLYERMIPNVEKEMATDLANFKNSLNATCLKLKHKNEMTPFTKVLWGIDGLLLLISIFVAGMWYKDPGGNYEPVIVALGLIIPLLAIGIKFGAKK